MEVKANIEINEEDLYKKIFNKLYAQAKQNIFIEIEEYLPQAVEKYCANSSNFDDAIKASVIRALARRWETGFGIGRHPFYNKEELENNVMFQKGVSMALLAVEAMKNEVPDTIQRNIYHDLAQEISNKIRVRYTKDKRDELLKEIVKELEKS
jgi:hypothetical protein